MAKQALTNKEVEDGDGYIVATLMKLTDSGSLSLRHFEKGGKAHG